MKILLDHNLDRRLKNCLTEYETATTQEQNWADALNGELLALAEENGFDVLLTADSNIKNQQNLSNRRISILVLRAFNNRLATHAEMLDVYSRSIDKTSTKRNYRSFAQRCKNQIENVRLTTY